MAIGVELRNYMELVVEGLVDQVLKNTNACQCDECRMDVIAITLNSLPPKYVVTKQGSLYAKVSMLQQQLDVDIISAITISIEKVKQFPRHAPEENVH